ncbi:outer membrane protein assembly factor BamB precursor [mine drainage metagenome]|uniref:Outer membrane protein assembly factor BamB n=1 Tax=mine drainage metagenome TaxID=410659 RepID=A0A1J5RXU4_9ZZZZ
MKRLVLIVVLSLLAGCSTLNKLNPFSSSEPKLKPAELTPFTATAQLSVDWQASIGTSGEYVFTPAVVGTSVYAAARDGTLARFDAGHQVWRINVGQVISGGVGSDGKLVVVGTPKGEVLAVDAQTGRQVWTAQVSSEVLAAPAVGDGLVVVRSGDARLFGFEAADGKRRWVYQRSTPALSLRSHVGVVLAGPVVLAGFPGGKLVAVSSANGAALWEVAVAQPKGATELERIADIASPPVINGREVCAVAYQGRVACYDTSNGNQLWAHDMSSSAGLDIDAKAVYVSDDQGAIYALDRANGAGLWKQDKLLRRSPSRPLALGKYVAVADYQGVVHLLRRADGAFAARITTDGSAIAADPQRSEGADSFVVQTRGGGLYAISAR